MALDAYIDWLASIDSTNAEAMRRAAAGERGPVWIVTTEQRAGRGRRGRAWRTDKGNLAATLLIEPTFWRPGATPIETATLSFAASLAVADVIEALEIRSQPRLKWPNDVLLGGSKVAGVLLEARAPALVIGVGVNLVSAPLDLPDAVTTAGALCAYTADLASLRPERLMPMLASCFERRFDAWRSGGFPALREDWLERAAGLRGPIAARLPNETLEGRFADVDDDGALLLETSDGRRRIHAADIYWPSVGEGAAP